VAATPVPIVVTAPTQIATPAKVVAGCDGTLGPPVGPLVDSVLDEPFTPAVASSAALALLCLFVARKKMASSALRYLSFILLVPLVFVLGAFVLSRSDMVPGVVDFVLQSGLPCAYAPAVLAIVVGFLISFAGTVGVVYGSFGLMLGTTAGCTINLYLDSALSYEAPFPRPLLVVALALVGFLLMMRQRTKYVKERVMAEDPSFSVDFTLPFTREDVWKAVVNPTAPLGTPNIQYSILNGGPGGLSKGTRRKATLPDGSGYTISEVVNISPYALVLKQVKSKTSQMSMVGDSDDPGIAISLAQFGGGCEVTMNFYYNAMVQGIFNVDLSTNAATLAREWTDDMTRRGFAKAGDGPSMGSQAVVSSDNLRLAKDLAAGAVSKAVTKAQTLPTAKDVAQSAVGKAINSAKPATPLNLQGSDRAKVVDRAADLEMEKSIKAGATAKGPPSARAQGGPPSARSANPPSARSSGSSAYKSPFSSRGKTGGAAKTAAKGKNMF